jgi:hypothetical protein
MPDWVTSFKAYFGASSMDLLTISQQREYFFARMEPGLSLSFRESVTCPHGVGHRSDVN